MVPTFSNSATSTFASIAYIARRGRSETRPSFPLHHDRIPCDICVSVPFYMTSPIECLPVLGLASLGPWPMSSSSARNFGRPLYFLHVLRQAAGKLGEVSCCNILTGRNGRRTHIDTMVSCFVSSTCCIQGRTITSLGGTHSTCGRCSIDIFSRLGI